MKPSLENMKKQGRASQAPKALKFAFAMKIGDPKMLVLSS